jgi:hypothetical protein
MLDLAEPSVAIARHQGIDRIAPPFGQDGAHPQRMPCAPEHGAQSQISSACGIGAPALDQQVGLVPIDSIMPIKRLAEIRAHRGEIHPRVPVVAHHEGRAARAQHAHSIKHEEHLAIVECRHAWVFTVAIGACASSGIEGVRVHRDVETSERAEIFFEPDQVEAGHCASHT